MRRLAMRFRGIQIPQGATIKSATLSLCSYTFGLTGRITAKLQAEAADNPADFTARRISSVKGTTASRAWSWDADWNPDTWYAGPDITQVLQEVIDRPGWAAGNAKGSAMKPLGRTPLGRMVQEAIDGFGEPVRKAFYTILCDKENPLHDMAKSEISKGSAAGAAFLTPVLSRTFGVPVVAVPMVATLIIEGPRGHPDLPTFRLSRFAEGKPIRGTYGDWLMC